MENESPKYPHNVLEAYGLGALMDLRVRMAFNMLQSSPMFSGLHLAASQDPNAAKAAAALALAIADEVLKQGAEKGWVSPLPDPSDTSISDQDRAQAARTASYSVLQQMAGQKFAQAEQAGQVIPVAPRGH